MTNKNLLKTKKITELRKKNNGKQTYQLIVLYNEWTMNDKCLLLEQVKGWDMFTEVLVQYGMRCGVICILPYAYSPCKDFIANYISRFIWKQQ